MDVWVDGWITDRLLPDQRQQVNNAMNLRASLWVRG